MILHGNADKGYLLNFHRYYIVVDALLKTGFTADEIGKIGGGNFLRVFDTVATHSF